MRLLALLLVLPLLPVLLVDASGIRRTATEQEEEAWPVFWNGRVNSSYISLLRAPIQFAALLPPPVNVTGSDMINDMINDTSNNARNVSLSMEFLSMKSGPYIRVEFNCAKGWPTTIFAYMDSAICQVTLPPQQQHADTDRASTHSINTTVPDDDMVGALNDVIEDLNRTPGFDLPMLAAALNHMFGYTAFPIQMCNVTAWSFNLQPFYAQGCDVHNARMFDGNLIDTPVTTRSASAGAAVRVREAGTLILVTSLLSTLVGLALM